jgi:hypothetical protein
VDYDISPLSRVKFKILTTHRFPPLVITYTVVERAIDQIVTLRKTLSTKAKPRLTMSFSKGNNLIYHPLNYMLFIIIIIIM